MAKRVLAFVAKKGGAGKTYTASAYLENARTRGRSVSAWDLDGQTGSLAIRYGMGNSLTAVAVEDIRDANAPAQWLDAFHSEADDVLLDVPGGALIDLLRTLTGGASQLVAEAKASGREFVVVSVLTHKFDGTATAQEAVEVFGSSVRHVIVKNEFFAPANEFVIYDGFDPGDGTRKFGVTADKVKSAGGIVLRLPRLSGQADALAEVERMTFAKAADSPALVGRKAALNIRGWLAQVADEWTGTPLDPTAEKTRKKAAESETVA